MIDSGQVEPIDIAAATANPNKLEEIEAIVASAASGLIRLMPRPSDVPDVVEDGETLVANARLKAVAIAEATGGPAMADDTGLEVDALDGRPGVHSARYAGDGNDAAANMGKLVNELAGVSPPNRTARFRTVVIIRWPNGEEIVAEGTVEGRIAEVAAGVEGFGYDPLFVPIDGDGRSFAEMSASEKNELSHRSRAVRAAIELLAEHQTKA